MQNIHDRRLENKAVQVSAEDIHVDSQENRLLDYWLARWTLGGILLASAAVAAAYSVQICTYFFIMINEGFLVTDDIINDIGMEGVILFRQHDRDHDGYLSLSEFEPLAHRLSEVRVSIV